MKKSFQTRSSSNAIAKAYDTNCKPRCELKMGISERFEAKQKEPSTVKADNESMISDVFEDTHKQRQFQPILKDVIFKALNDTADQEIFRTGLQGMARNYPEILNGTQKHLFMCPSGFNYDSRIKTFESSVPKVLEERKAALEENPNRTPQEQKDLEDIDDHLSRILPQISEQEFFNTFTKIFFS